MTRITKEHSDRIIPKNLEYWANHKAFTSYASCSGKNGLIELGVNGTGMFAVLERLEKGSNTTFYKKSEDAINAYTKLII